MTGYSRVYNKQSGDVILAEEFVTEFGSIDAAFDETTGHSHSGATGEGAPISVIGNAALTTKVEIDSANNEVEFHANGAEQVKITDGAILPITDNDIDLGAVGAEFKNLYIDGTANIDNLVADTLSLGSITLTTDLAVVDGGTGASTAAGARTNLGLGSLATASTINNDNWSGTDLSVVNGGTGASDAATARSNLGLVIGTNVQAYDADLSTIAGLAKTDGNFIVGNGSAWTVESGATARTSLGLGSLATLSSINNANWSGTDLSVANGGTGASDTATARTNLGLGSIATQAANNVNIDGGTIDGTAIGGTSPSSAAFTNLLSSGLLTANIVKDIGYIYKEATDSTLTIYGGPPSANQSARLALAGYQTSGAVGQFGLYSVDAAASTSYVLLGNASGYLTWSGSRFGIGETSPDYTLHMTDSAPVLYIEDTTNTYDFGIQAYSSPVDTWRIGEISGNRTSIIMDMANQEMKFNTAGSTVLIVQANGCLNFVPQASDPAGAAEGDVYYNTTTNKLKVWTGSAWSDLN